MYNQKVSKSAIGLYAIFLISLTSICVISLLNISFDTITMAQGKLNENASRSVDRNYSNSSRQQENETILVVCPEFVSFGVTQNVYNVKINPHDFSRKSYPSTYILSYIIQNYDKLPDFLIFYHGDVNCEMSLKSLFQYNIKDMCLKNNGMCFLNFSVLSKRLRSYWSNESFPLEYHVDYKRNLLKQMFKFENFSENSYVAIPQSKFVIQKEVVKKHPKLLYEKMLQVSFANHPKICSYNNNYVIDCGSVFFDSIWTTLFSDVNQIKHHILIK